MATVILVRHGRSTANSAGILAGRSPGVALDASGRTQARAVGDRLAGVRLRQIVSSPLKRCRQTAQAIMASHTGAGDMQIDGLLNECDYGDWQGKELKQLADDKLWSIVQNNPSAAVFPGGESLASMQRRAVAAVRDRDAQIENLHGSAAVWVAVTHGDIIKSIIADALGMHLDMFQRIVINPASASMIHYSPGRPAVIAYNSDSGSLKWLDSHDSTEAGAVGGGAGPDGEADSGSGDPRV